ncbi:MAG: bacteriophage Gp15 family protein, partial [Ruminococcus sp.]|nr:bacteriophage Gp15 family protein [Ruminococcus sp.]
LMRDKEVSAEEKILLLADLFFSPPKFITQELVGAVGDFYKAENLDPKSEYQNENERSDDVSVTPPVFDWKIDSKYILGDFQRYYGIDLLDIKYMHWWKFRCLFEALPDDSPCQKRIAYRSTDVSQIKNAAERRRIMRIKQAIAITFEYDDDMIGVAFGI